MKSGGQKQDVGFLALAVAVLAVAVALFVGMKSMQKQPVAKPGPAPEKQTQVARQVVESPKGGPRDPFKTQGGTAAVTSPGTATADRGAPTLKLVGIVSQRGDQPVAIINSTKRHYYARVGQRAAGYTVTTISGNQVVLEKDGELTTLLLHQPVEEEQ